MEEQPYSKKVLGLQSYKGFLEAFQQEIKHHKTYKEAYENVELRHLCYYSKRRYSCFESFKTVMSRNNKKKKKKK